MTEDKILIWVCLVSELVALRCMIRIASDGNTLARKLFWTVVVLVPIVGPLLYFAVPGGRDKNFPDAQGGISRHGLGGN